MTAAILMMAARPPVRHRGGGHVVADVEIAHPRRALLIAAALSHNAAGPAVCEAFIHAVTATLAGMAIVSNAVTAYAVGMLLTVGWEGLVVSLAGLLVRRDARAHAAFAKSLQPSSRWG
ncbi:MAG: hypothetical protein ACLR67_00675 [Eggerthella lenta]